MKLFNMRLIQDAHWQTLAEEYSKKFIFWLTSFINNSYIPGKRKSLFWCIITTIHIAIKYQRTKHILKKTVKALSFTKDEIYNRLKAYSDAVEKFLDNSLKERKK